MTRAGSVTPLSGLLTVAACAVLAGASSFAAITDWLHDLDEHARDRLGFLDTSTGIVLAQVTVDAKSNEIPAFTPLLDAVPAVLGSLTGILFVADALHTQTGHAVGCSQQRDRHPS